MKQPARRVPGSKGVPRSKGATRSTGPRRFVRRLRRRLAKIDRGRVWSVSLGTAGSSPWLRRGALAAALLGVAFVPNSSQGGPAIASAAGCHGGCRAGEQNMLRWSRPLPGAWDVLPGLSGTVPASGLAYAAAGDGVVVVGTGMTVYAYAANTGKPLWQYPLLDFPAGAEIVSVRTWPGEVTAGVSYAGRRTEVVIADSTGLQTGQYPAAAFGGAVAGSATFTVIVGSTAVTSYNNATGRIRWQRSTGQVAQGWQVDGRYLYVAESAEGYLGSAPVTALRRIDTVTGAEQEILPSVPDSSGPDTDPDAPAAPEGATAFDGTLASAFDGVVLFSGASGVTAYSGATGVQLWSIAGAVPEGTDPRRSRFYLTRGSNLLAVNPLTGRIGATAPVGGLYVVRDGMALGLDLGADGDAWGYSLAGQRVAMTASALGWPHYFVDLSGLGGSADPDGDLVVIASCAQVGPAVTTPSSSLTPSSSVSPSPPVSPSTSVSPSGSGSSSSSPSSSPSTSPAAPVTQPCQLPRLVALGL